MNCKYHFVNAFIFMEYFSFVSDVLVESGFPILNQAVLATCQKKLPFGVEFFDIIGVPGNKSFRAWHQVPLLVPLLTKIGHLSHPW